MLSLLFSLFLLGAPQASANQLVDFSSDDKSIVECRSSHVMDAGYNIRVTYERGIYTGMVRAVSFAGMGHRFFVGALQIRKYAVNSAEGCSLQLIDSTFDEGGSLDIRISPPGYGRIIKLEGRMVPPTPNSFVDLMCVFDHQMLKGLGCAN